MQSPSVGIVGSESLLGREVREVLRQSPLEPQFQLIGADDEEAGKLTDEGEEPAIVTPLDERNLASADLVLLAGSVESSRKAWSLLSKHRDMPVIDLTRALEDADSARVVAPAAGRSPDPGVSPVIVAHPAAIALAVFFRGLAAKYELRRAIVEIFEPASERAQAGVEELHQQTKKLFAFQTLPKDVFDTQLAYAMLARFGLESPHNLEQIEGVIERHLASLLSDTNVPMPSLRLVQAPVFHGYSISAHVEFASNPDPAEIDLALHGDWIETISADEDAPSNVTSAGQTGIRVGDIRVDRNNPRACWFWITADNFRILADSARQVMEALPIE
jgi:aspartate-semialdehyde dehydrogenase